MLSHGMQKRGHINDMMNDNKPDHDGERSMILYMNFEFLCAC